MSPTAASTSAFIAPTGLAALLAIANGEAEGIGSPIEAGDILKLLDPNHESESRSMELILAAIIPTGIAFAFVLLRLWMRIKTNPRWALDDWLIIPALALGCGSATNTVYGAEHAGVGKHAWELEYDEVSKALTILYLHLLSYGLAVALTKVSIIFFVRRIAGPGCSRVLKWILWGNFWYMVVFQIALVLLYTFQCMPAGSTWDLSMRFHPDTHCVDHLPLYYVGSALHAVSDLTLLAAPIVLVWKLQMRRKKKMMVIFMLSLGGVACVCSLVRMAYILDYSEATDLTWDAFEPCLWGHLEVALAIIAACCPALRPLFARMMPDLGGSGRSRPSRDRTGSRLSSDLFGAGVGAHQSSKGTWTTRASVDGVKLGGNSGLWGHDRGGSDAMLVEEVELGNASVNRKGLEGLQNANVVRGS